MMMSDDKRKVGSMLLSVGGIKKPTSEGEPAPSDDEAMVELAAHEFMSALKGSDAKKVVKAFARLSRLCPEYMAEDDSSDDSKGF